MKVYVEIDRKVLTDGSEVFDVILNQNGNEIVINCTDETSAYKTYGAITDSLKFFSNNY